MSLKTGDWVIVRGKPPNTAHQKFVGVIRQVGEVVCQDYLGKHWQLVPPTLVGACNLQWTSKYLRKLEDPSDDAVDESSAWLPPIQASDLAHIREKETT